MIALKFPTKKKKIEMSVTQLTKSLKCVRKKSRGQKVGTKT